MTKTQTPLDDFEKLLEQSYTYKLNVADVVKGIVVKREKDGFLIDIGAKCEAFLPDREVSNFADKDPQEVLKLWEEREFFVVKDEDEDENIIVSLKKVACAQAWNKLQEAKANQETINAKVASTVKGGVIVEVMELRGFVPSSQLRTGSPTDGIVGQELELKVLEADPKRNKLILSQRQVFAQQREMVVDEVLSSLEIDQVVTGEVVRIADFGAFVDISGIDGLLPISEISWQRIKHPSDVISLGDKIEVKIIKIDNDLKRISLSLKRMGANPWDEIADKFKEGDVIKGTVNKVTSFGAFINIYPGVEALLPSAEMKNESESPFNVYRAGDEIDVLIKKFTPSEHRIGLSVKDI